MGGFENFHIQLQNSISKIPSHIGFLVLEVVRSRPWYKCAHGFSTLALPHHQLKSFRSGHVWNECPREVLLSCSVVCEALALVTPATSLSCSISYESMHMYFRSMQVVASLQSNLLTSSTSSTSSSHVLSKFNSFSFPTGRKLRTTLSVFSVTTPFKKQ